MEHTKDNLKYVNFLSNFSVPLYNIMKYLGKGSVPNGVVDRKLIVYVLNGTSWR